MSKERVIEMLNKRISSYNRFMSVMEERGDHLKRTAAYNSFAEMKAEAEELLKSYK